MKFVYSNPTKIFFGQQQIASIQKAIPTEQSVLVIYGGGSIKKNGIYDQVKDALKDHNWMEFSGVEPNPTKETLDKAVALIKEHNIDFILAVGGGSVIDGSKYVAAAAHYDGDGWDILTGKYTVATAVPIGAILTLPATGSESNPAAVITKAETHDKLPFFSDAVQPQFAVMDPDAMKTLPERQLVNGLVDAWVHTCEQYLTTSNNALVQDGYAEVLLRNLIQLADQYPERDNDLWRANFMWTANQALNGLIGAGVTQDWATHMIGHELTALYDVDHARSLAMVQPSLLKNQIDVKREKLEQMGRNVFGLSNDSALAEQTITAIEHFYQKLDVSISLNPEHRKDSEETKETAIERIIQQLESHGMTKLGEHQAITLKESKEILEAAVN